MERAFVPVLLQELLLPFRLLLPALLRMLQILLQPLFLGQRSPSLDLFALEFACEGSLLVTLDTCKLAQSPCLELASGVKPVGVIDVRDLSLLLL